VDLCIYGYFGRGNLGDEALALVWRDKLSTLGPARTLSPPRLPGGGATVFTGEPLQDRTSRRSFLFYAAAIRAARRRGPVILGAVGVDVRSRIATGLLPRILHDVDYISVRDPRSHAALRSRGIAAREARDAALLLPSPRGDHAGPVLLNLVPGLPAAARGEALAFAREAARALGKGLRGLVMARGEDDRSLRGLAPIVPRTVGEALEAVAEASLLIGSRLHALEFALICGTPFVAVPYAPKVDAFLGLVEADLPGPIPRLPGPKARAALGMILANGYRRGLARARERLRGEAEEGVEDVLRFIREMA